MANRKFVSIPELGYKTKKWFIGKRTEPEDVQNIFFGEQNKSKHYQVSEIDNQSKE